MVRSCGTGEAFLLPDCVALERGCFVIERVMIFLQERERFCPTFLSCPDTKISVSVPQTRRMSQPRKIKDSMI